MAEITDHGYFWMGLTTAPTPNTHGCYSCCYPGCYAMGMFSSHKIETTSYKSVPTRYVVAEMGLLDLSDVLIVKNVAL